MVSHRPTVYDVNSVWELDSYFLLVDCNIPTYHQTVQENKPSPWELAAVFIVWFFKNILFNLWIFKSIAAGTRLQALVVMNYLSAHFNLEFKWIQHLRPIQEWQSSGTGSSRVFPMTHWREHPRVRVSVITIRSQHVRNIMQVFFTIFKVCFCWWLVWITLSNSLRGYMDMWRRDKHTSWMNFHGILTR